MTNKANTIIANEDVNARILWLREQKVMLDYDLAELYQVETRVLNQAVARNIERFPIDFMFQLTPEEFENWRSQIVMSNPGAKMGLRRPPFAFTEQGIAMLSGVLKSERAIQVNIAIMRAFVRMREFMLSHKEMAVRIDEMEAKYDKQFAAVFDALRQLLETPVSNKNPIGYIHYEN
ncbi:MAG: ORF6N domain-containing protein [Rhodospirillales bacterium]|nr:ORF6N domain-containing protein [Rhodospirillales bacterium]